MYNQLTTKYCDASAFKNAIKMSFSHEHAEKSVPQISKLLLRPTIFWTPVVVEEEIIKLVS